MNKQKSISPAGRAATSGVFFIVILGALMAFTSLSTDIYLPLDHVVDHDGFYTTESGDGHQTKNSLRKSLLTRQSGHCPCLTSRGQI